MTKAAQQRPLDYATTPAAAPAQTEDGGLLEKVLEQTAGRVDDMAGRYLDAIAAAEGHLSRALLRAKAIEALRKAIRPLMVHILPLMNTPLGFMTDRDPKRSRGPVTNYPIEVVEDCVIEAMLRRLRIDGNEWNIISGTCYTTKNGYARLVAELPGLTDLQVSIGVPALKEGGALVRVRASWKLGGAAMQLTDEKGEPGRTLAIRVNSGMGADAIAGKAERKALAAVYKAVTGSAHSDGDTQDDLPEAARPSKTEALAAKLGPKPAGPVAEEVVDLAELAERQAIEADAKE